ncbi:alpha/beta hydrolase [Roseiconus nitratireducens]|uniref:Alpha/beta hydrolase n=1 Tax=Roseiconus nitratireducens TaxID=2605748 RepID=A0A5M6DLF2_9BACT|nr:alpha/beta family hydrolase [Roseiconus nitratireducens]KAA5547082.1 alpha/beta hydrolase [Roseiconus nitratireducens]
MPTTDALQSSPFLVQPLRLAGVLTVPADAKGLVVFAHGSDSTRFSPRNQAVARRLQQDQFATILFDFLHEGEAADRSNTFNPKLLGERLKMVLGWIQSRDDLRHLPLGLFGASTGMAAVVTVAAEPNSRIGAIVSRGGRTDLVQPLLGQIQAPTLLVVGENDTLVLQSNRSAMHALTCPSKLEVIPGATHLFSEPGKLESVADIASKWFRKHLAAPAE